MEHSVDGAEVGATSIFAAEAIEAKIIGYGCWFWFGLWFIVGRGCGGWRKCEAIINGNVLMGVRGIVARKGEDGGHATDGGCAKGVVFCVGLVHEVVEIGRVVFI